VVMESQMVCQRGVSNWTLLGFWGDGDALRVVMADEAKEISDR
jgi:hypothetical protein